MGANDLIINNIHQNKSSISSAHHNICDSLMRYAEFLGYGDVHIKIDKKTGLKAIIAIHNLTRGPAIGGCRMVHYNSVAHAMEDALRLGYMMSYKAAITNLPHGGGKAVIIKPAVIEDRDAYFEKFGEFINELGGRYITAVDSGTSPLDMDIIARRTPYVTCTSKADDVSDPSASTALGVRLGIEAAVKFKFGKNSMQDVHVSIQGCGHVGHVLAKELKALGAVLTLTDTNTQLLQKCASELGANTCAPEEIYNVKADVFSPCALGAVINKETIKQLQVKIVAGAANNQLAHKQYGTLLHERGILYAPDFLINSGGLILVAENYAHHNMTESIRKIHDIYDIVYDIFVRSEETNRPTHEIAEEIAEERLYKK